ncbi:MAG: hypothetical protein OEW48_00560 [Phycisphaerae bacterium]|nr:hypothetical protein [Phycisphaerae bacterium]
MNCAECKELLVAYVEQLLDKSQEKTVYEHVEKCQSCRAEASELKTLQERLVKNGKALSESGLEDKVLNQIIREQNVRLKSARKAGEGLNIRRIIMKSKITKAAAAAVIIFAVLIGINIFGGTVTFAKVAEQFLKARTVVYDFIIGDEENNPVIMHEIVVGPRIRRTISNLPGMTQIIDMETGKMLALNDVDKTAAYVNIKGVLQERTRGYIEFVRKVLMELKDSQKVVKLGEQEIEGRKAIGFSGRGNNNQELKIWADPKTAVPIRVELRLGQLLVVFKNFQFDEPIDDSQVSMEVPEGYKLEEAEIDFTKGTEEDFIKSLRVWAEVLLDGKFPDAIGTERYMKQMPLIGEKLAQSGLSKDEAEKLAMALPRGMFFLQLLEIDDKYHYAGKGVKLGEADKAIFWYRPKEAEKYRVIYGDLSVKEVSKENLPK